LSQSDREFHIFEVDAGRSSGIFRLGVAIGEGILGLDRKDQGRPLKNAPFRSLCLSAQSLR